VAAVSSLRSSQQGRRLEARLRAGLRPVVERLSRRGTSGHRLRNVRQALDDRRAGVEHRRAQLRRLEGELRAASREEGALRAEFLEAVGPFTPFVVAETPAGTRYLIPTADKFSRQLFVKQQRREIRMLGRVQAALEALGIDRGRRIMLDVGGNIGTGPVEAVCTYGFDRAIAFEPHPDNWKVLRINTILNGAEDKVTLVNAAVADREGTAMLSVSSKNSGAHSLSGGDVREIGTVEVATVTIDGLAGLEQLEPDAVSLLWMDIEGYEVHALQGAQSLVERSVPFVMELNPSVLRAAGRADQLVPTLEGYYTHVVNLRDLHKGTSRDAFQPLGAVTGMLEDAEENAMDVLACRLA
jgi:FkbM family methyltransferase